MKEYRIKLDYEIGDCTSCPFKNEHTVYENINSRDVLTGTMAIIRKETLCPLLNERIDTPHQVNGYKTKCPLMKCIVE